MVKNIKAIEELVSTLNVFRESKKGESLSREEVCRFLKHIPGMTNRTNLLIKHHIMRKVGRGSYMFYDEPIYFGNLKSAMEEASTLAKQAREKRKANNNQISVYASKLEKIMIDNNISDEDIAKYLVDTGNYQISKKVVTWENI